MDEEGTIRRYWLEAERSRHKVGGPQVETDEERTEALARNKATASVIGVRAMGTRFNVLMNIQIPLKQKPPSPNFGYVGVSSEVCCYDVDLAMTAEPGCYEEESYGEECCDADSGSEEECYGEEECAEWGEDCMRNSAPHSAPKVGSACAARVSRGTEVDTWEGLSVKEPTRHPDEHVTCTVVIYNAISGGVPSEADVVAAIDDLEQLYTACGVQGRLAGHEFDFMKEELKVKDMTVIADKMATQPYTPPPQAVANFASFPA